MADASGGGGLPTRGIRFRKLLSREIFADNMPLVRFRSYLASKLTILETLKI